MEEDEKAEPRDQGIIKTSDPDVLAAILHQENPENVQNREDINSDNEEILNNRHQNNDIPIVMEETGDVLGNDGVEFLADSLELERDVHEGVNSDGSQSNERSMKLQKDKSDVVNSDGSSLKDILIKSEDSSTPSSQNIQNRNSAVKPHVTKQKPKVNFIDQNKGDFSRKPGKSSYAALYSQKLKSKQGNSSGKKGKVSDSKEKEKQEDEENNENITLEQYDQFNESSSSLSFKTSNASTYTNFNKGLYYNVDTYGVPHVTSYSTQSYIPHMNQSLNTGYDGYLNQPYQVPYKDFGLRYSSYGHQSFQTSSAMSYPRQSNVFNPPPVTQIQGYASQSAPPGVTHYHRRPLIDQVEFFPEHDHFLSQSLTNSQFINPQQIYQRDSVLERKFVSEPLLSNSPQPLSNENERASKISNATRSNSDLSKPVDFKPYTLKDYRQIKNEHFDVLGSLGPDTESEDYKEKITKLNKQRQYAEIIRLEHAARKKQWEKKAAPPPAPARQLQAEAKRQAAMNYAKTVPKPKVLGSRQPKGGSQDDDNDEGKEVTLIELLKIRHDKEKNEVQALRKEMTSKTDN